MSDPVSQEVQEGQSLILSCTYHEEGSGVFFWEFHQHSGECLTIRRNDSFP